MERKITQQPEVETDIVKLLKLVITTLLILVITIMVTQNYKNTHSYQVKLLQLDTDIVNSKVEHNGVKIVSRESEVTFTQKGEEHHIVGIFKTPKGERNVYKLLYKGGKLSKIIRIDS